MSRKADQGQRTFVVMSGQACCCQRCGVKCKIDPVPGSKATMLKRGNTPKGLCINCAVHDQLRHLYPANLLLARSGPKGLALPHIQRQLFAICQISGTDARFEEIDWQAIIANWDLPFAHKIKRTATNPVTQEELDRERTEGMAAQHDGWKPPLSEQEQRAKRRSELDHAIRNVVDLISPGKPPIKTVHIRESIDNNQ